MSRSFAAPWNVQSVPPVVGSSATTPVSVSRNIVPVASGRFLLAPLTTSGWLSVFPVQFGPLYDPCHTIFRLPTLVGEICVSGE